MDYVRALKLLAAFALFGLGVWVAGTRTAQTTNETRTNDATRVGTTEENAASERADRILDNALRNGSLTKSHRQELVTVVPSMTSEARADLEDRMREAAMRGDLVIATNE